MPLHFQVPHTQALSANTFSCPRANWPWWDSALMKVSEPGTKCCLTTPTAAPGLSALTASRSSGSHWDGPTGFWLSSPCWDCSQPHQCAHYHTWFTKLHVFLSAQLRQELIITWKIFLFAPRPCKKSRTMLWLQVRLKPDTGIQWDFTHTQLSISLSFLHLQRSGVARSLFTLLKTKLPHPPSAKPSK